MKKSKAKLIKSVLESNGIDLTNKAGYRRAKARYNQLSKQSKAKVG